MFRLTWSAVNIFLLVSIVTLVYTGAWEYSVRHYLDGFSDAIVPNPATPEQKVEAILNWMRSGPPRPLAKNPAELSARDPEVTLNYRQLLTVCGTATNAFLNLARSSDLDARRLLLLTPEGTAKHVVAEVRIADRWIVVDPTYRLIMRDPSGRMLTRQDLKNPATFAAATSVVPNYPQSYSYESFAHVRLARMPFRGLGLRGVFDALYPGWEEAFDWSLLLERESFFFFFFSWIATLFFVFMRLLMAWYADRYLGLPRFRFFRNFARAGATFFSTPEIEK